MSAKKQTLVLLSVTAAVLLIIPGVVIFLGWQWTPAADTEPFYVYLLYLVTESGTLPYALFTAAFLALVPVFYLRLPIRQGLLLILVLAAAIGTGQLIKSTLKSIYQEPRPYVAWLDKANYIHEGDFYQLNRTQRARFIAQQDFSGYAVPVWMQSHWSKETGFSFPSGHSIFVAQWAMMLLLLLKRQRAYVLITLVLFWALMIEASRLLLGMHWPVDIIVSCVLALPISYLAYLGWERWVFTNPGVAALSDRSSDQTA